MARAMNSESGNTGNIRYEAKLKTGDTANADLKGAAQRLGISATGSHKPMEVVRDLKSKQSQIQNEQRIAKAKGLEYQAGAMSKITDAKEPSDITAVNDKIAAGKEKTAKQIADLKEKSGSLKNDALVLSAYFKENPNKSINQYIREQKAGDVKSAKLVAELEAIKVPTHDSSVGPTDTLGGTAKSEQKAESDTEASATEEARAAEETTAPRSEPNPHATGEDEEIDREAEIITAESIEEAKGTPTSSDVETPVEESVVSDAETVGLAAGVGAPKPLPSSTTAEEEQAKKEKDDETIAGDKNPDAVKSVEIPLDEAKTAGLADGVGAPKPSPSDHSSVTDAQNDLNEANKQGPQTVGHTHTHIHRQDQSSSSSQSQSLTGQGAAQLAMDGLDLPGMAKIKNWINDLMEKFDNVNMEKGNNMIINDSNGEQISKIHMSDNGMTSRDLNETTYNMLADLQKDALGNDKATISLTNDDPEELAKFAEAMINKGLDVSIESKTGKDSQELEDKVFGSMKPEMMENLQSNRKDIEEKEEAASSKTTPSQSQDLEAKNTQSTQSAPSFTPSSG